MTIETTMLLKKRKMVMVRLFYCGDANDSNNGDDQTCKAISMMIRDAIVQEKNTKNMTKLVDSNILILTAHLN